MCSGKVYFDLLEERDARGITDVYLLRFEQFYPFPAQSALNELKRFKNADMVWCQEEPKNQGAWAFMEPNIEWVLTRIKAKIKRPRLRRSRCRGISCHRSRKPSQSRTSSPRKRCADSRKEQNHEHRSPRPNPRRIRNRGHSGHLVQKKQAILSLLTKCSASLRQTKSQSKFRHLLQVSCPRSSPPKAKPSEQTHSWPKISEGGEAAAPAPAAKAVVPKAEATPAPAKARTDVEKRPIREQAYGRKQPQGRCWHGQRWPCDERRRA